MSRGAEIFINDGYTSLRSLGMSALRHANDHRRNKFEPLNRHVDPRHVGTEEIIILGDGSTAENTAFPAMRNVSNACPVPRSG